jgi:acetyltransferase-like isoleucine patch superfamily enzyme
MNIFSKTISHLISIPARIKGMKFGKNSFIGPRYDIKPILRGVELGDNVIVGKNAWFDISRYTKGAKIFVGDGTQAGRNLVISACKNIYIGKECLLSYNVSIMDHDHNVLDPDISPLEGGITEGQEVIIEGKCFIGAHSFILKGVHLGKHCVVGANSVVTDSFPSHSVVAGNPAKLIRTLKQKENYEERTGDFRDHTNT